LFISLILRGWLASEVRLLFIVEGGTQKESLGTRPLNPTD
jgi:hypothetical protein